MNIAIILLDYPVNSPRRCDALFDDLKPRRIIDVTANGRWIPTLRYDIVDCDANTTSARLMGRVA